MKKVFMFLLLILLSTVIFAEGFKTSADFVNEAKAVIKEVSPEEANEAVTNGKGFFLDVRDKNEVEKNGKIKDSVNISRGFLEFEIEKNEEYKTKPIYVYCELGGRGAIATKVLMEMGYEAYNIKGGFSGWKAARMPIEK